MACSVAPSWNGTPPYSPTCVYTPRRLMAPLPRLRISGSFRIFPRHFTSHLMLWHKSLPPTIARHRMIEQLLWLSQMGICYSRQHNETVTQQVRDLLVNNLHKSFTAAEVAEQLLMNEVMLRRRLATENSVLRNLMIDVRMTHALRLLQCTDLAISNIAHQVGYESSSRFAERFRKRFGFAPTSIRGHLRPL